MNQYREAIKNNKYFILNFLLLIFYILISSPILQAGFFSDDVANSLVQGHIKLYYKSLWDFSLSITKDWIHYSGRVFPIAVFGNYAFFYLFTTALGYQLAHIFLIWMSLISSAWAIKLITNNYKVSLLFLFIAPSCWSIRYFHDPLTSFGFFLPFIVIAITLSLAFFVKYNTNKKIVWLALSLFMYICALLTYEIGITTFFLICSYSFFHENSVKKMIVSLLPHCIVTFIYVIVTIILHQHGAIMYSGLILGSLPKFWVAFATQLTSSLPLSYWFLGHNSFMVNIVSSLLQFTLVDFSCVLLVFLISFIGILNLIISLSLSRRLIFFLLSIGAFLVVIPSILIGMSEKYQAILSWGLGYLPVYLEYIGMAMVFLALFSLINFPNLSYYKRNLLGITLTLFITSLITLSFIMNNYVVNKENEESRNSSRILVVNALQAGFLKDIPNSTVIIGKPANWHVPAFYMQNADLRTNVLSLELNDLSNITITQQDVTTKQTTKANYTGFSELTAKNHNLYFIDYDQIRYDSGYVIYGQLKNIICHKLRHQCYLILSQPRVVISANSKKNSFRVLKLLKSRFALSPMNINQLIDDNFKPFQRKEVSFKFPAGDYMITF